MRTFHIPVTIRIITATVLLVVIVGELTMLVPSDPRKVERSSWVQRQLQRVDADAGLSPASRRRILALLERSRADLERTPWEKLFLVAVVTFVVTTVINAVIWTRVIQPLRKVLEAEVGAARRRGPPPKPSSRVRLASG